MRRPLCFALLPGALLIAVALARPWLEATMARHMAIELPLLFAIGWLAARVAGPRWERWLAPCNANGLPAFCLAMLVGAFWMLPVALDLAVLDVRVSLLKVISVVGAGLLLGASWRYAGMVIQAFFVLNWAGMNLAAGLLYQEAQQQLCSVYLSDQQAAAGWGIMFWSLAVIIGWLPQAFADPVLTGDNAAR